MEYCVAILMAKINNNSRKTYRGFAAYEARQGGVVGNNKLKKWIFLPLMPRWQILFKLKSIQKASGLPYATLPTIPNHKIQQSQAWPTWRGVQIKSMPLPPTGSPLLYFFPLLDIALFVLLKLEVREKMAILFRNGAFNHSLVLLMIYISQ